MFTISVATAASSQVIGNVIISTLGFIILIVLIRAFAWKQITSIFTTRAKKINDDIDDAENAKKDAEALVTQRQTELAGAKDEAQNILKTAQDTAAQNRDKMVADTNAEVAGIKAREKAEIEQERKEALSSVKGDVASISLQIAEKLIGKSLDANSQSEIIDQYLAKLEAEHD